jgi:pimeloyl-ACP methyl ester carboxylesterase
MKKKKILLILIGAVVLALLGAFAFLSSTHYKATADVLATTAADQTAVVAKDRIEFWPADQEAKTGFILYPGGNVDFRAYAPLARDISREGYFAVVARMPLSLAVFNKNRADDIICRYPEIKQWVISGHSLGGVMAARYALDNKDIIAGLVLLASYPDQDLSAADIKVLSILGTKDGVINLEKYESSKPYLPGDTIFVPIVGGNHAYFGNYGFQKGDMEADLSLNEQQKQIVAATVSFLQKLETGK